MRMTSFFRLFERRRLDGADAIALGDSGQRLAARDHVAHRRARHAPGRATRSSCPPAGLPRSNRRCLARSAVASAAWCCALRNEASSRGFEMYAVSTSTDGMSGDFSTRNGACCTCSLRIAVTAAIRLIKRCAAAVLALSAAFCDRSSSTRASN